MSKYLFKNNNGFVALIFVIMITSLFIVSSVIIAMINTSNNMANYHVAESNEVMYNIDACLSDALWQIASSTNISGSYSISLDGVECAYQIAATDNSGYKIVTSTATTSSSVGNWNRSVVMLVNVSSSPFLISSHKDDIRGICLNNSCCGDGVCNVTETCTRCSTDCGSCPVCGNGVVEATEVCDDGNMVNESCGDNITQGAGPYCNSACTVAYAGGEVCDDGNVYSESCGDAVIQSGNNYCNSSCSATLVMAETCEFSTPAGYYCVATGDWCGNCLDNEVSCPSRETALYNCHDCVSNKLVCVSCE